jgi:hypothetical protein
MIGPLVKLRSRLISNEKDALDKSRILTSAIRGFVSTITIPFASSPIRTSKSGLPSTLTLVSRLSCRRAGTRFNSRGIDDDGNVSRKNQAQETVFESCTNGCFRLRISFKPRQFTGALQEPASHMHKSEVLSQCSGSRQPGSFQDSKKFPSPGRKKARSRHLTSTFESWSKSMVQFTWSIYSVKPSRVKQS